MINNLLEEPQSGLAFSNFRTKQSVLKRKLGAEFAKREWDVSSAGFGGDVSLSFEKRHSRKPSKYNIETLPKQVLATDSKSIPNPTRTEFFCKVTNGTRIYSKSSRISKRSYIEENESKSRNHVSSKRPSSVFLEVQNIQNDFQKNHWDVNFKPIVKLPSEFSKKFKAEILCDGPRRTNKPKIELANGTVAQIKPYCKRSFEVIESDNVERRENKCRKFINIQSNIRTARNKIDFKSTVKAVSDFQIKTDVTLEHVDNTSRPFLNEKTIEFVNLNKKSVGNDLPYFSIKSDLTSKQANDVQNIRSFLGDKLSKVSEFSKELSQNTELCFQIETNDLKTKRDDIQNESNLLASNKSSEIPKSDKKSKIDSISKSKLEDQNVFQNSFREHMSNTRQPSPMNARNFMSNLLPNGNELAHMPKKLKLDKSTFIMPSELSPSNVACKVKKINVSATTFPRPKKEARVSAIAEKSSNDFPTNFEFFPTNAKTFNPIQDNESSFQGSSSRNEISLADFSRLLENKSDGSKGSNWMQSLRPTLSEENDETDHEEPPIIKKIRNILPGGFAEQILKLQRKENSEKVIWSHKIHRNKRKAQNDSLSLILKSISSMDEFIIAKASLSSDEESQNLPGKVGSMDEKASLQVSCIDLSHLRLNLDASKEPSSSETVFILFKRKTFTRLQLKLNDVFKLYQPWQMIYLKCIPHPFILCAYFIDVTSSACPRNPNEENIPVTGSKKAPTLLKPNIYPENDTHRDLLFFKRDDLVTFSARVQRVWKKEFKVRNPTSSSATTKYLRYSVLLQIKEGTFHELRVLPDTTPDLWYEVIAQAEGRCFLFHNLCVAHRVHLKRDKYLQDILETLHLQNGGHLEQDFCYQLMFDSSSRCPEEIPEIGFPGYSPIIVQPLLQVVKMKTCERFTCIAKVLLQYKDVFYISDESLLLSPALKYTQLHFLATNEVHSSLTGSVVLVKEALVEEGGLLIDKYSQLVPLFEASLAYQQLSLENTSKAKMQANVRLEKVISFLHLSSEVDDLVCIKGEIASVDESAAFTWLQCSFCLQENLVQDTNLVIYCEDCSRIVPSPVLNVKLEVVVQYPQLPSVMVNVQLLSTTIKRILQIPEGAYQPQCSVCDVLGKEIGPLYCRIQSRGTPSDKSVFNLLEVCSS